MLEPSSGTSLGVVTLSNDVTVATYRDVLFTHFRRATPASCGASMKAALATIMRKNRSATYFGVIELESDPPDEAARDAITNFFEEGAPNLSCAIVTYRGEGFRGAMVRTIVSGIFTLAPRFRFRFPRHVVGTLDEAVPLAVRYSPGLEAAELVSAFRRLAAMSPEQPRPL